MVLIALATGLLAALGFFLAPGLLGALTGGVTGLMLGSAISVGFGRSVDAEGEGNRKGIALLVTIGTLAGAWFGGWTWGWLGAIAGYVLGTLVGAGVAQVTSSSSTEGDA
ncbi:MAG: hypothetical protein OEU54_08565 [Gemmatimonadota bacterium]|nr:hypothetical protein [Gemmatimonadota bacterium]